MEILLSSAPLKVGDAPSGLVVSLEVPPQISAWQDPGQGGDRVGCCWMVTMHVATKGHLGWAISGL